MIFYGLPKKIKWGSIAGFEFEDKETSFKKWIEGNILLFVS